jgi:hypothetical protein
LKFDAAIGFPGQPSDKVDFNNVINHLTMARGARQEAGRGQIARRIDLNPAPGLPDGYV